MGAGETTRLINNALFAGRIRLLAEAIRLSRRLGVPEPALLAALSQGSAASRVLSLVAPGGSLASFIDRTGEFLVKDVAVVRAVAAELGGDLGATDDVIDAIDVAKSV